MSQINIIGKNIKDFRENFGHTQQEISDFLGIAREEVSYYETGARAIPLEKLTKLTDLFGIDLCELLEEDKMNHSADLALAFRKESFCAEDFQEIANFKKIIKNYIKLKRIANKYDL